MYSHIDSKRVKRGYWTKEKCKEEALKYSSAKEFQKNCRGAYGAIIKNGWLGEIKYTN